MRDDRERLLDLREAIERIEKYTAGGRAALERDELIQTWVIYHLQIIGEAARALSPELRDRYSDVPWSEIVGMRNILAHRYFGIDVDIVWSAVEDDLPQLKHQIDLILSEMESAD
jgi:uncharacterized protein with HEPN domain